MFFGDISILFLSIYVIFTASLSLCFLPPYMRTAKVIPVHKPKGRSSCSNYRPISLTNTICKMLEHVISFHISLHFQKHFIIGNYHHSFRIGHLTITQLTEIVHKLGHVINKGKNGRNLSRLFQTV